MSLFVTPEHLLCVHHRVLDYQTVSLVPLIGPIIHYSSHYLLLSLFASLIICFSHYCFSHYCVSRADILADSDPFSAQFHRTPLHWAADQGNIEVMKELVAAGAHLDGLDKVPALAQPATASVRLSCTCCMMRSKELKTSDLFSC